MTLIDFLTARLDEDEAGACSLVGRERKDWSLRWRREVEAKRLILEEHRPLRTIPHGAPPQAGAITSARAPIPVCDCCRSTYPCVTLWSLLHVYSDHPDYREEWA